MDPVSIRLIRKTRRVLLPQFAEKDFITLAYILLLTIASKGEFILSLVRSQVSSWSNNSLDILLIVMGIAVYVGYIFYNAIKLSIGTSTIGIRHKSILAEIYYVSLAILSIIVALFIIAQNMFQSPIFFVVLLVISVYEVIRSFLSILAISILGSFRKAGNWQFEHLLSDRFSDAQVSIHDLILIISISSATFIFMLPSHALPITMLVAYFYTTVALSIKQLVFVPKTHTK